MSVMSFSRGFVVVSEADERIERALGEGAGELDLSGLGLSRLPESLRDLTWLTSLNLNRNALAGLPDWLGELTSLTHIDLR